MAARQVILYFDDQQDALRFALAAGSVMSGDGQSGELIQETQRACRIRLEEAANASRSEKHLAGANLTADALSRLPDPKPRI
jgi:hypothetical protein